MAATERWWERGAGRMAFDDEQPRDENGRFAVHSVTKSGAPSAKPSAKHSGEEHFTHEEAHAWKAQLEKMNPTRKYAVLPHVGGGYASMTPQERSQANSAKRIIAHLKQKAPGHL